MTPTAPPAFPALPTLPAPWPALGTPPPAAGDFDPAGPLALLILLPLVGALVLALAPRPVVRLATRAAVLWTLPGALFLLAAAWFGGAAHGAFAVRWLERLPGGGGLVLSIWNLVPALLVGLAAPLALAVPEAREKTPSRAAFLLVLTAANLAVILAVGPGVAVAGWLGGAWALCFLLGEADAVNAGQEASAPFVLHAFAGACVLAAALAPPFLPLLLVAGVIRLGVPPTHGVQARTFALLPTGALLLVVVGFAVTGLAAARDGVAALRASGVGGPGWGVGAAWLGPLAVASALAAAWVGFVALAEGDLKRRLAGFASAQGALWVTLLLACDPTLARPAVGAWALVTLVTLVLLVLAYAPLWAFARTGDLKAYGGLGRVALVRSTLLLVGLAALVFAPVLSARGAGAAALVDVLARRIPAGGPVVLGGALGLLAVGLSVYRTIRGETAMPLPAPDLSAAEWCVVVLFGATLFLLSALGPPLGGLGSLWPVFAAAGGS